jgi:phage shock protein A
MTFEKKSTLITEEPSFEAVLNTACDRLQEKQIQYSIQRIREMDEELDNIEKELEEFINRVAHNHS